MAGGSGCYDFTLWLASLPLSSATFYQNAPPKVSLQSFEGCIGSGRFKGFNGRWGGGFFGWFLLLGSARLAPPPRTPKSRHERTFKKDLGESYGSNAVDVLEPGTWCPKQSIVDIPIMVIDPSILQPNPAPVGMDWTCEIYGFYINLI